MGNLHKLPEYRSLDEKKEFFTQVRIDTEKDFEDLFKIILPQKFKQGGIWRGIPESRFKLYNSLQRENIKNKKIFTFEDVKKAIENSTSELSCWNREVVRKYFLKNHSLFEIPHYAALSIMQHYGCKTPLLDWTRNPNVALYFALNFEKSLKQRIVSQIGYKSNGFLFRKNQNIEDYFSLYHISNDHPYIRLSSKNGYYDIVENDSENKFIKAKVDFVREHGGDKCLQEEAKRRAIDELIQREINRNDSIIGNIRNTPIQRIEDEPSEKATHFLNVNYNINAQHGLFILNADPFLPLEEAIYQRIAQLADKAHENSVQKEKAKKISIENFLCFDIHKRFIPQIVRELNSDKVNITKETMEPDFNKLKETITFDRITRNIR